MSNLNLQLNYANRTIMQRTIFFFELMFSQDCAILNESYFLCLQYPNSNLFQMISEFQYLEKAEQDFMYSVPVLVSILIAGADSSIDKSEITKAVSTLKLKQSHSRKSLTDYYKVAGQDFEDKLKVTIAAYPNGTKERNERIVSELEKLNGIFTKIDQEFAIEFYNSIKDIAKKIAEASGGVLGYMAVGYEESKFVDLKMIKEPHK